MRSVSLNEIHWAMLSKMELRQALPGIFILIRRVKNPINDQFRSFENFEFYIPKNA